jgi:CRISPR/Cas system CSM-associated protein Csm4 (group 5 of RAMP superfamily)
VVNALKNEPNFEEIKKVLLSERVCFCNAYPMEGEEELLPSPKGFYADKADTKLENSLLEEIPEGYKRASLGAFCSINDGTVSGYNVRMGSDLKINMGKDNNKQNVFRNEYIVPNQMFCGYIYVGDDTVEEDLKRVLTDKTIVLGNARSAGYGKCMVECKKAESKPFEKYMPAGNLNENCYMMLLSNTVMRDENGEYCGINVAELENLLGVENLKISSCATSTVDVRGYNRTWGGKTPSVVMYEKGSVFCLKFDGELKIENMKKVCETGIGVRKNEGFGRVLFLKNYAGIKKHGKCSMVSIVEILQEYSSQCNGAVCPE